MGVLSGLEPTEVFRYFEEICSVPHPSYKEEKISDYCVEFAKQHDLTVYQDELKNVIIIKEATEGYEDVPPIIIQGHLDMVCEKEPDYQIDFENDGLELEVNGDYISAKGTTLGGDDGIAVAMALAILSSKTIKHPRLEVVFTVSEEVGMEGASGIDLSILKGKKLLNVDSEEEGHMLTSCAGGCSIACNLPVAWEERTGIPVEIAVTGLVGGHSGVEINKGRANANLLLGRVLLETAKTAAYSISAMQGGGKDNAIPREATAGILLGSREAAETFIKAVEGLEANIREEYAANDPDIRITAKVAGAEKNEYVLTPEEVEKVVLLVNFLPNGIQRMSGNIEGLVESSLNLGILTLTKEQLTLRYAVRISVKAAKENLCKKLDALTTYLGGETKRNGDYPPWEYKKESKLREDMVRIYREMYKKELIVEAVHAGLECGILSGKIDGLDCVSIGPDMIGIHTTEEKLSISSTKRVWEYILEVIKSK